MTETEIILEQKKIILEQRAMLNTATHNLDKWADLLEYFFDRMSFYLTHKPIAEYVEGEVRKDKARRKRFYKGYPGVPAKVIDPASNGTKLPFKTPRKRRSDH